MESVVHDHSTPSPGSVTICEKSGASMTFVLTCEWKVPAEVLMVKSVAKFPALSVVNVTGMTRRALVAAGSTSLAAVKWLSVEVMLLRSGHSCLR